MEPEGPVPVWTMRTDRSLAGLVPDVCVALSKQGTLRGMLQACAESIVWHVDAAFARIWTLNPRTNVLELESSAGLYTHLTGEHSRVQLGQLKIGLIAQERRPHLTNDVLHDPRIGDREWARREGMVAFAGHPLIVEDRLVGVVAMFARQPLSEIAAKSLASVADMIALGIERKRSEESLARARRMLEGLFEFAPDAIVVVSAAGLIASLNRQAEAVFGYSRQELVDKPVEWLIPQRFRAQHVGHRESYMANPHARPMGARLQLIGLHKDGREFPVDVMLSPLQLEHDTLVISVIRDITDRKRAEEELRDKTSRLQTITDAMSAFLQSGNWREASILLLRGALRQTESEYGFVGVVVDGPTLRVVVHEGIQWDATVNREFYEKSVKSYLECGYIDFTNFKNLFGQVITSGLAVLCNEPGIDIRSAGPPPGHPPLHNFLGVPSILASKVVGMIGVANRPGGYSAAEQGKLEVLCQIAGVLYESFRRLERESVLQEQLRQSQKIEAVGRLAGGVAHDFNNLLTVIMGYTHFILDGMLPENPMREHAEVIKATTQRATALTRQLLAFSRRQVLQPTVLQLNSIVGDMEKMLRRLIGENVSLVSVLHPALGRIMADSGQIEQVIMNLVVNARDAMPDGGKLIVETMNVDLDQAYARQHAGVQPGPYVMLAVSDTGCGMDAETQSHIFEPFFTTKGPDKGTGLGLATVYGIVQQSAGSIWVYSEPGRGTSFRIYLPRVDGPVESKEHGAAVTASPRGSETILLVEDDEQVRKLVCTILRNYGYKVLEASAGAEALQICDRNEGPIHLLMTDMIMPRMSGKELAQRITQVRPEIRVLFMSGYTDNHIATHGTIDKDVALIQKPFSETDMLKTVRIILGSEAKVRPTP